VKKTFNIALIILFSLFVVFTTYTISYATEGVTIGQATSDEHGNIRGGKAGDQSGSEVSMSKWDYSSKKGSAYNWQYVVRAKDPNKAKQIANNMIDACNNNHIGYDQKTPDRNTFFDEARKANWNISDIKNNCETTCASAVSVCVNAAGIKTPKTTYSGILYKQLMDTGEFISFTNKDYTANSNKLLPGDILISPNKHTAMVVKSPNKFTFTVTYKNNENENTVLDIEENTDIILFGNDGKEPTKITVDKDIDLASYSPEKASGKFIGWENDGSLFKANYSPYLMPIDTNCEIKKIKG
jgi:hypothetical protein